MHGGRSVRRTLKPAVGDDGSGGRHMTMTDTAPVRADSRTRMFGILAAAFLGLGLVTVAGHVQASALHDAAHDVRHATGFPCH